MKITAIAPWFGSKRNLAPEIVKELGPHRSYWELFGGSLAVLLVKDVSSSETVNDQHGDLINLARVLKDESLSWQLYDRLMRFVMHEDLFHEAAGRWKARGYLPTPEPPSVDRAEEFMVCSWFAEESPLRFREGENRTRPSRRDRPRACHRVESGPHNHHRHAKEAKCEMCELSA